jgi:hypothetical protein
MKGLREAPSLQRLIQKIEKWAPPKYRVDHARLYADLESSGIAFEVLSATQISHGFEQAASASHEWEKNYWHERERIEKQIQKIRAHPLVLQLEDPIFREVGLPCPHGRNRLECETIRGHLLIYLLPPWPRAAKYSVQRTLERKERARKDLAAYNLGFPEKLNLADFCMPSDKPDRWQKWNDKPAGRVGRPPTTRIGVLTEVMAALKASRLPQAHKIKYIRQVLLYCFDDDVSAEELAARWREIKRQPKTDTAGWIQFE